LSDAIGLGAKVSLPPALPNPFPNAGRCLVRHPPTTVYVKPPLAILE
jgi:hypothetical protein